ncbi:MAG TPA: CBS domain-containing protein [Alphaproteobacteria bacterium]|nr:CBS domain-containing protein [Alphaproteobacteria bacterium]
MLVESVLNAKGSSVVTAKPDTPVTDVAKLLADAKIGAVVISADNTRVEGILSERDIVNAIASRGEEALRLPASALMTRDVVTCTPQDHIADLMGVMTEERVRHLPVLIEGALAGIISIGDVVRCRVQEISAEAEALRTYVTQG